MVKAIVEHFLKEEFFDEFDSWFNETESKVSSFEGFSYLRKLNVQSNIKRFLVEIEFNTYDNLIAWNTSLEHTKRIFKIAKMSSKPYYSFIYTDE